MDKKDIHISADTESEKLSVVLERILHSKKLIQSFDVAKTLQKLICEYYNDYIIYHNQKN